MSSIVQAAEIQCDSRGNSHVREDNSSAGLLRSTGRSSTLGAGESTGSTLLKARSSRDGRLSNGIGHSASCQSSDGEIVEDLRHCDVQDDFQNLVLMVKALLSA